MPAVLFCLTPCICTVYFKRLTESMFYDMPLLKILNVSERPRTGVVRSSSDVFAQQKLASRSVHGCTLLDSLFQKAYGKVCFKCCRVCRNAGDTVHLLRCIIKSVHPCTLLMANFGKAEISLLFKPAASVPMFKRQCRLNLQVLLLAKRCC